MRIIAVVSCGRLPEASDWAITGVGGASIEVGARGKNHDL